MRMTLSALRSRQKPWPAKVDQSASRIAHLSQPQSHEKDAEDGAAERFRSTSRTRLIAAREALDPAQHEAASAAIETHLGRLLQRLAPAVIGFCWPFRAEFDCRPLMARCMARGARTALPVMVAPRAAMIFREWREDSAVIEDRFGIHIPRAGATLVPDVILMPVNAFDEAGYRLGYGGGYFDRTLAALSPRPCAIGVGFELARLPTIRPQGHDQRLDYVVTEAGCFRADGDALVPMPFPAAG